MQVTTHENFAKRIGAYLGEVLPTQALISGAVAPNRDRTWPRPHHLYRRVASTIAQCVRTARKDYVAKRVNEAAFHLGVATHYALDNLVPYPTGTRDHAACEGRFAELDRHIEYPDHVKKGLADGRSAERAVGQLVRLASVRPLNFEQRLQQAHLCLLRLACAVAEEPEPLELVNELADAFVELTSQLEIELARYRKLVEAAFAQHLHGSWDWGGSAEAGSAIDRLCRKAVGTYEVRRSRGETPGSWTDLLREFGLWRFRRRLLAALEDVLHEQGGSGHFRRQFRTIAGNYNRTFSVIQARCSHWRWFDVGWDFWEEKSGLALKWMLRQAREARLGLVEAEEQEFRKKCAAELLRERQETGRDGAR